MPKLLYPRERDPVPTVHEAGWATCPTPRLNPRFELRLSQNNIYDTFPTGTMPVATCASCFTPGKETQYPLYMRLGGPKGLSGRLQKVLPTPSFNLQTVQPIVHCCTDYAVPCISLMCYKMWNWSTAPLICLIIVEKMTLLYVISLYVIWVVHALFLDLCTLAVTWHSQNGLCFAYFHAAVKYRIMFGGSSIDSKNI